MAWPRKAGYCGGSLVASKYVITAGHCTDDVDGTTYVIDRYPPSDLKVSIGDHNLLEEDGEQFFDVRRIARHPMHHKNPIVGVLGNGYDIAILELKLNGDGLDLTRFTPVCLAKETEGVRFDGKVATAAGWGQVSYREIWQSAFPNEVDVTIPMANSGACKFPRDQLPSGLQHHILTPNVLCAGKKEPGKGTCKVSYVELEKCVRPCLHKYAG